MYGSATAVTEIADCGRTAIPARSRASCRAGALIILARMPAQAPVAPREPLHRPFLARLTDRLPHELADRHRLILEVRLFEQADQLRVFVATLGHIFLR